MEWVRRLSVELLKESPSPALRSCWALANIYNPLARSDICSYITIDPARIACRAGSMIQYGLVSVCLTVPAWAHSSDATAVGLQRAGDIDELLHENAACSHHTHTHTHARAHTHTHTAV